MALIGLPEGVKNITFTRAAGSGKKRAPIFDSSKEKVLIDLEVGIREAQGRYQLTDANTQGAASVSNHVLSNRHTDKDNESRIMEKPYASTCWAPITKAVDPKDKTKGYEPKLDTETGEELVRVYIKCKGAKVEGLLADKEGNEQTELQLLASDLVPTLEYYQKALGDMTKDSELGAYWHDVAVFNAFAPKQRKSQESIDAVAHCLQSDRWEKKADVKEESPYPRWEITLKED